MLSLDVDYCTFGDEGAAIVADVLANKPSSLTKLDISVNHIGVAGGKALARVLHEVDVSLSCLLTHHAVAADIAKSGLQSAW